MDLKLNVILGTLPSLINFIKLSVLLKYVLKMLKFNSIIKFNESSLGFGENLFPKSQLKNS